MLLAEGDTTPSLSYINLYFIRNTNRLEGPFVEDSTNVFERFFEKSNFSSAQMLQILTLSDPSCAYQGGGGGKLSPRHTLPLPCARFRKAKNSKKKIATYAPPMDPPFFSIFLFQFSTTGAPCYIFFFYYKPPHSE